jgi:hypothetical protein
MQSLTSARPIDTLFEPGVSIDRVVGRPRTHPKNEETAESIGECAGGLFNTLAIEGLLELEEERLAFAFGPDVSDLVAEVRQRR